MRKIGLFLIGILLVFMLVACSPDPNGGYYKNSDFEETSSSYN